MKKVKALSETKQNKTKQNSNTDDSMMITKRKGGLGEVEGKVGVNGDGKRLDLGVECPIQYTDNVL